MKPVDQTRFGFPDGNCFAACLASLTERPIEDFDLEYDEDKWRVKLNWHLRKIGLFYTEFAVTTPMGWCGEFYAIGGGKSKRGFDHACIVRHEINAAGYHEYVWIHDPHPDRSYLELDSIGLLVPTWSIPIVAV